MQSQGRRVHYDATRFRGGMEQSSRLIGGACRFHQGNHPVAKPALALFTYLAKQAFVGCNKPAVAFHRKGEIEAVAGRMSEFNRDARSGFQQGSSRQQLDFRCLEEAGGENGFVLGKLVPLDLFPKNVRALGYEKFGCDELGPLAKRQRLGRPLLFHHPKRRAQTPSEILLREGRDER